MIQPCNGKHGKKLLSEMKKHLNKSLPNDVKRTVIYEGKKLTLLTIANDRINYVLKIRSVIELGEMSCY